MNLFGNFLESSRVWVFDGLWFFKVRGGAAMALNVLKVQGMWVGKFLESSRVWAGKVLCKVAGGCGREKCVKSALKVRGKFEESSKEWAWKVRGKLEGVNKRKVG